MKRTSKFRKIDRKNHRIPLSKSNLLDHSLARSTLRQIESLQVQQPQCPRLLGDCLDVPCENERFFVNSLCFVSPSPEVAVDSPCTLLTEMSSLHPLMTTMSTVSDYGRCESRREEKGEE